MRPLRVLAVLLALMITAGCGLLGGGDQEKPSTSSNGAKVEKANITVRLCCGALDVAPFYLAMDNGYFKQEGLDIKVDVVQDGGKSVEGVISGDAQIAFASYTPFLGAQAKKVADLKLVGDASSLAPKSTMLVGKRDAPTVTDISQLAGKKVAITAPNTLTQFLVQSAADVKGVDPKSIKFVPMGFPDMAPALGRGDVDAALITEPFVTAAQTTSGVTTLYDMAQGPTADMPIGGYGALAKFVSENPNTVAAFQRGLIKATDEAIRTPNALNGVIEKYGKLPQSQVQLINRTAYQKSLDPVRIQRVADLMQKFGALTQPLDVKSMIVKPAA